MHRICAAVCETARLAHWRRNLDSNPLVPRKQETLFRRVFFDRFGLQPPHSGPRGTEGSNLAPSSEESCELRYGRRRPACDPYAPYGRCRKRRAAAGQLREGAVADKNAETVAIIGAGIGGNPSGVSR
jgi:hypothetical protein